MILVWSNTLSKWYLWINWKNKQILGRQNIFKIQFENPRNTKLTPITCIRMTLTLLAWYRHFTIKSGGVKRFISLNLFYWLVWFMVFNATFKNVSVISWRSVLLVEETRLPGENHRQTLSQCCIVCTLQWTELELTTLVVIGTDCSDSCKSNYHTTKTVPF